jgi:hypothetical protein
MALRTFAHLYDNYEDARQTVEALEAAKVPHDLISIVSNNADHRLGATGTGTTAGTGTGTGTATGGTSVDETRAGTGASTGTIVGGGVGLLTGLGLLAIPGIGPVVAAGWLVATLTGAGIGAAGGGLLGSLVHAGVSDDLAHTYTEGVRRGGTLVTVRADENRASIIEDVLNGRTASAVDVTRRRADYETTGWKRFEETEPHYTPEQVEAERLNRTRVS